MRSMSALPVLVHREDDNSIKKHAQIPVNMSSYRNSASGPEDDSVTLATQCFHCVMS